VSFTTHHMDMFVYYICTWYMHTSIKVCSYNFMEMHQDFNHQIISKLKWHKKLNFIMFNMEFFLKLKIFNIHMFFQFLFKCYKFKKWSWGLFHNAFRLKQL
jgi:hypothetical protein